MPDLLITQENFEKNWLFSKTIKQALKANHPTSKVKIVKTDLEGKIIYIKTPTSKTWQEVGSLRDFTKELELIQTARLNKNLNVSFPWRIPYRIDGKDPFTLQNTS